MHTLMKQVRYLLVGIFLLAGQSVMAAGLMTPKSANLPQLEIRQHHVEVTIEDGYAVTSVEQVFYNPNDAELEAIYSFPVPEKASVGEFTYWIDGKPISGEVLEKQQAREVYQQEREQGREAALTEQDSYRTFDSQVYPVRPQQDVRIRLVYIQPAHVDSGIGRYVYPLEEGGVDEQRLAFWSYNDVVTEAFSFNLKLRSSYPIDAVRLPQHPQVLASSSSPQEWSVSILNGQPGAEEAEGQTAPAVIRKLDKDIVVYWRHQQGLPGSVDMLAHKEPGKDRGSFMLTVTPGDDLASIDEGRDWVFVLDLSGSMEGKYQSLVEGVRKGLVKLSDRDRFKVVLFNNRARELTYGYLQANINNVQRAIERLENTRPSGGTNLYAGLERGIEGLDSDRSSAIVLVTDGVANVGITEKKDFLKLLERYDVRLFTFVMGNSANRPLLDGMTKVSNGFAINVSNSDDIVGQLMLATDKLTHEALHDIEIGIRGVKVKDLTPARIGSLYRGQQLILFGHYWGDGIADVTISGKVSGQPAEYSSRFEFPSQSVRDPEIERLWAFATIEDLQNRIDYLGEDADSRQAIVDIAMEYSLVTDYTSMIVLREEQFQHYGIDRLNKARVASEQAARQQRSATPVVDNRVDRQQPMYSQPRAYPSSGSSGGGALGPWLLLLLIPLWQANRHRRKTS
ncbi:MAG: VIT and VWA domain-containing protein [Candidatus Thiodiazotropha sp. (ex Codakia orbicularis)]|nr:VIT and VWA domain-containing protein [Candidatus Thiodiazotropha sp. (ex Codakia orbicularis)]